MARNFNGQGNDLHEYEVGLSLGIETKSQNEEDELHQIFYKVVEEYNTNPVLLRNMNSTLKTNISKINFSYTQGDPYVKCLLIFKSKNERKKFHEIMKDSYVPDFFTNYLNSTGLSTDLGRDFKEEVDIIVIELPGIPLLPTETKDLKESSDAKNEDSAVLEIGPIQSSGNMNDNITTPIQDTSNKLTDLKIRIYVPYKPCSVNNVHIVWKGENFRSRNVINTHIWTAEFPCQMEHLEFNISISYTTSGWMTLMKQEQREVSPIIHCSKDQSMHHLIFPYDANVLLEALTAFTSFILNEVSFLSHGLTFKELDAMDTEDIASHELYVGFKHIKRTRVKEFVNGVVKSLPIGLHSQNIPPFCYLIHILKKIEHSWTDDLIDKSMAKNIVKNYQNLKTGDFMNTYGRRIGKELQFIYCIAVEENASLIGFTDKTFHFLGCEHIFGLFQTSLGKKGSMPLYTPEDKNCLVDVLHALHKASQFKLLEMILRHLCDYCAFSEYISITKAVLNMSSGNEDIYNKFLILCRQKLQHCLALASKTGGLKELLRTWQKIECLGSSVYDMLIPQVEKGIVESIGNEGKVVKFDDIKNDFMNTVLKECMFDTEQTKIQLLTKMSDGKISTAVRFCFLDLITSEKFEAVTEGSFVKLTLSWLQTTLQVIRTKYNNEEKVIKTYERMSRLMKIPRVTEIESLYSKIDNMVLKSIEQNSFKELMKTIPKLDTREELQNLFQNHLKTILQGKHAKKSPKDVIQDICGTGQLRVNSKTTVKILKDIIDLFAIEVEENLIDIFWKAVDHSRFWIAIFNASGNDKVIKDLQTYQPCIHVRRAIRQFNVILKSGKISFPQLTLLKQKENDVEALITNAFAADEAPQSVKKSWIKSYDTFAKHIDDINIIKEVFRTLKERVHVENKPVIITETLDFLSKIKKEIDKEQILFVEITQRAHEKEISEMAGFCRLLIAPIKSQVFWNVLHDYFMHLQVQDCSELGQSHKVDSLDGISLPELFGMVYEPEITMTFDIDLAIAFTKDLSSNCFQKYRHIWMPYINEENGPLEEFKRNFGRIKTVEDMEREIVTGENFCSSRLSATIKGALLKFADLTKYRKTVEAIQISSKLFIFRCNVDTYSEIVKSFNHLFNVRKGNDENLQDMTFKDMSSVLDEVEEICKHISLEVTEILEVLKNSTQLLKFLDEVLDEDIRNLIDAVEEHSEQFVRESTVSDLIEVKRFFYPILKKKYCGDRLSDFFSLLSNQLKSGFVNMPAKLNDCMDNLHTLKALYKNVANRGERTREIIDSIVDRGKFWFRINSNNFCEIVVRYRQDKKTISHGSADLNDLRSRALLLLSADEKDKKKQKTRKPKADLEKFLVIVDTVFDVESMFLQLRQTGHFDFISYEYILDHKELSTYRTGLESQLKEWEENISECRHKYLYMNYIYPNQLQQLFEYLCKKKRQ